MSAATNLIEQLAQQFAAGAAKQLDEQGDTGVPGQQNRLGPWVKVIATAVLVAGAALTADAVRAQPPPHPQVLSEQSAERFGGQLGSILFREAASATIGGAVPIRGVDQVIFGAAQEMGRNTGRILAGAAHPGQHQHSGDQHLPQETIDHLDQLGLHAAFTYDEWMRMQARAHQGMANQAQLNQARNQFFQSRDAFSSSVRSARLQGHQVHAWAQMSDALRQRVVNEPEVSTLALGMAERLNRPGGPGYRDPGVVQERTSLSDLREQMNQRQSVLQSERSFDAPMQ